MAKKKQAPYAYYDRTTGAPIAARRRGGKAAQGDVAAHRGAPRGRSPHQPHARDPEMQK